MSSSLWTADRKTHIKIMVVSLVAASIVVAVGLGARTTNSTNNAQVNGGILKAGGPAIYSASDVIETR